MTTQKQLFLDFKPITKAEWTAKIQKDLKGKPFEKLFWQPEDDISIPPFFVQDDISNLPHINDKLSQKSLQAIPAEWIINERFDLSSPTLIDELSNALQNDVTGFTIAVSEQAFIALPALFKFIDTHQIRKISFSGSNQTLKKLITKDALLKIIKNNPEIRFSFEFNFLSELTRNGEQSVETDFIISLQKQFTPYPNVRYLTVNADYFYNAGSSVVQELTYTLNIANYYLSFFDSADEACSRIAFLFAAGSNYFMEIAKLRAFRILWSKLLYLHDSTFDSPEQIFISSETAMLNKTIYDPFVNMLRNTTEAMAAIIGGINELTVLPFNFLFENNDDFGKRIARNVQHLLKYETYLDKEQNISAGSYYIENLTHILSEKVWQLFIDNESAGGYEVLFQNGTIKHNIEENAKQLINHFNKREKILVGINNYPNVSESILEKIGNGEIKQEPDNNKGLRFFRLAENLEELRLSFEKSFPNRPKAFLFTYGNLAMRRARAGFSLNFLGAAGFDIFDNNGFSSIDEGIAAFEKSDANILVICSSDEEYPEILPTITNQIKNKVIIVAGNPKNIPVSANVDYYIYAGSNIFDVLQKIRNQLLKINETV